MVISYKFSIFHANVSKKKWLYNPKKKKNCTKASQIKITFNITTNKKKLLTYLIFIKKTKKGKGKK
jgi:hypothetical protein